MVIIHLGVVATACGSDGPAGSPDIDAPTATATPTFEAAFDCAGLADRWGRLQQEFLDRLGDADAAELEDGSDRVATAQRWIGNAMIEQARDSAAVGCETELTSGSAPLCDQLDAMTAGGEAAEFALAALRSTC